MSEKKERTKAIIGTVLFHIGLLAFMILMGLRTPLPLPGEEGVEVNLGYYDVGSGIIQLDIPKIEEKSSLPVEKKDANEKSAYDQTELAEYKKGISEEMDVSEKLDRTGRKSRGDAKDKSKSSHEKRSAGTGPVFLVNQISH